MTVKDTICSFENLSFFPSLVHGISTKAFGSMKIKDGTLDCDHLETFRKALAIEERAVCMQQVHGGTVSVIPKLQKEKVPSTDGLVTNTKHIPLAVLTADCLPILFCDPQKEAIGVAHAGYKGLLNHIIEHTIDRMISEFGSDPKDIIVGVGPGIERDCYEVGKEVIALFEKTFPSFKEMFVAKDGKYFLDLHKVAEQCLRKGGILKEHSEVLSACTKCDSNLYSYRRGDTNDRFVSIISLQ